MASQTLRYLLQKGAQALGVELRVLRQVLKQLLEAGVSHPLGGGPGLGGALVELLKEGAQGQGQGQGTGGDGPGLAGAVPLPSDEEVGGGQAALLPAQVAGDPRQDPGCPAARTSPRTPAAPARATCDTP